MKRISSLWNVVLLGWALLVGAGATYGVQDVGWPREIDAPQAKVVVYQPQLETFTGERLTARSAVSVTRKDQTEPVFGVVWFDCRTVTDRDTRTVSITDVKVPKVKFADATPEQEKTLSSFLEQEIPKWDLTLSQDRLLAAMETAEKEQAAAEKLRSVPPTIIFAREPTVLVTIDGRPALRPVENSKLMKVVNTPYVIVLDPDTRAYYLYGDAVWYTAADIMGPWRVTANPPASVRAVTPKAEESAANKDQGASPLPEPRIVVSTEPAELIVSAGEPTYSPLVGNELLYMSNTDADVLMDASLHQYYVLLSGRWFSAGSLTGPWAYVAPNRLPKSFAQIPAESDKGYLRASVAGTQEAQDAVTDNQIPQTTAVKRDEASLQVAYDGEPKFENIEGTTMSYAANTGESVLQIGGRYYACHEGVWFVSDNPNGPWSVSDQVPQEVQSIPPSNPLYDVKYVEVYDSTPEVVYTGYTPGYLGSYVDDGTVVWGTGYTYPGWLGTAYYPRPLTWGFGAVYNPWAGRWGYGLPSYNRGFVAAGGAWRGWNGGGWWGPSGYRNWQNANINRVNVGNRNVVLNQNNLYNSNRAAVAARQANVGQARNIQQANLARGAANNVFADREGNVYRRAADGGWQRREGNAWRQAHPAAAQGLAQRTGPQGARTPSQLPANRSGLGGGYTPGRQVQPMQPRQPSGNRSMREGGTAAPRTPAQSTYRPSNVYRGSSSLNSDYQARQRGTARTSSYQKHQSMQRAPSYQPSRTTGGARSAPRSSGSYRGGGGGGSRGGGSRGGGGGRR